MNRRYSSLERVPPGVDLGAGVMGGSPIRERCRMGLSDNDRWERSSNVRAKGPLVLARVADVARHPSGVKRMRPVTMIKNGDPAVRRRREDGRYNLFERSASGRIYARVH